MKRVLLASVAASLLAVTVSAADVKPAAAATQPKVAAVINGETLTVDQLNQLYDRLSPEARKGYDANGGRALFLEQYIKKRLILQQAQKENFDKKPEVAFDLQAARESALFDRYIRDVVAASVVTDKDMMEYYQSHQNDYRQPESVKLRAIVVLPNQQAVANTLKSDAVSPAEVQEKMKMILGSLKPDYSNFGELAAKYSEDASAKSSGDVGWIERGSIDRELENAAFALKPGQVSPILETNNGYAIVKVEAKKDAGIRPFADVRPDVREALLKQKTAQVMAAVNALTLQLQSEANVTVYRENL